MARNRFVNPDTDRLHLSDGDFIEVKRILNVGDQKKLEAAGVKRAFGSAPEIDWENYQIARAAVWITDWTFLNAEGKVPEVTIEALKALDVETFTEIQRVLSDHITRQEEARKNGATTTT